MPEEFKIMTLMEATQAYADAVVEYAEAAVAFDQAFQLAKSQGTEKNPVTDRLAAAIANDKTQGMEIKALGKAQIALGILQRLYPVPPYASVVDLMGIQEKRA